MRKEEIILSALTKDVDFSKKVLPHMEADFFQDRKEKVVFSLIQDFHLKYGKLPSKDVLTLQLEDVKDIREDDFDDIKLVLKSAFDDTYEYHLQWLFDETEKFCKDRAVYNAIMKSVAIINGDDKKTDEGQIPVMLQNALNITFDSDLGHDYFKDADKRYAFYHHTESKIEFSIDLFNEVTNGGVNRKTLNFFIAQPKGGKSLAMCSLAADYLRKGYNVVYITLELAEERVAERIDANLFGVAIQDIKSLDKDVFINKINSLLAKTNGRLRIKEYPTKAASAANFRNYLDDLKAKEDFVPDVVFIDYLGITASSQYRNASNVNTYLYQKAVSEELRAMAVELNVAVWSALQTNRGGFNSSDFDIDNIADSTGPLMTCDFAVGIIRTPDLDEMHQAIMKQLASRYGDPSHYGKFVVGIDKSKMRMYNVEKSAQDSIQQDVDSKKVDKPTLSRISSTPTKKVVESSDWSFDD